MTQLNGVPKRAFIPTVSSSSYSSYDSNCILTGDRDKFDMDKFCGRAKKSDRKHTKTED